MRYRITDAAQSFECSADELNGYMDGLAKLAAEGMPTTPVKVETLSKSVDLSALYRDDADDTEHLDALQALVDSGDAWRLEGSVGRAAMDALEEGLLILAPQSRRDYWGNTVPGRDDVKSGTKGSLAYARARHPERFPS